METKDIDNPAKVSYHRRKAKNESIVEGLLHQSNINFIKIATQVVPWSDIQLISTPTFDYSRPRTDPITKDPHTCTRIY